MGIDYFEIALKLRKYKTENKISESEQK